MKTLPKSANFPHLIQKVFFEPWFIDAAAHSSIQDVIFRKLRGEDVSIETLQANQRIEVGGLAIEARGFDDEEEDGPPIKVERFEDMAIVHVSGIIGKRLSWIEAYCGGFDIDWLTETLHALDADTTVQKIVLQFDSPGGTVTGLPEAADLISEIATRKHVVSFTDTRALSAAYYLAAQAGDVITTPSAQVGSIGVFMAFLNERARLEENGLTPQIYQAGTLKTAGHPWAEQSEDVDKYLQGLVDKSKAEFDDAVSARNIPESARQGQLFDANEGKGFNLVDDLVRDREELLTLLRAVG